MNHQNRLLRAGQLSALLLGLALLGAALAAGAPEQLRVLFLGDDGLHQPAERFKQLEPALAARGIELNYTDRLEDLNPL